MNTAIDDYKERLDNIEAGDYPKPHSHEKLSILLGAVRRLLKDPALLPEIDDLIASWDVTYRREAQDRLIGTIDSLITSQHRWNARQRMTELPKEHAASYKCRPGGTGWCSRKPKFQLDGYTACWQHEDDLVNWQARQDRTQETLERVKSYRDEPSVSEAWQRVNTAVEVGRTAGFDENHAKSFEEAVAEFAARWGGIE